MREQQSIFSVIEKIKNNQRNLYSHVELMQKCRSYINAQTQCIFSSVFTEWTTCFDTTVSSSGPQTLKVHV